MAEQIEPETLKLIAGLKEDPKKIDEKFAFMTQKHTKKEYDSIKNMSVGEIFDTYALNQKKVKYEEGSDFKDIIKIERKKKRLVAKKQREDNQIKLRAALESPERIDANMALDLADASNLNVAELTKKDIKRLKKLKAKANLQVSESAVILSKPGGDIDGIENDLQAMEAAGRLDAAPTMDEMKEMKIMVDSTTKKPT